jgi:hypothetical protein
MSRRRANRFHSPQHAVPTAWVASVCAGEGSLSGGSGVLAGLEGAPGCDRRLHGASEGGITGDVVPRDGNCATRAPGLYPHSLHECLHARKEPARTANEAVPSSNEALTPPHEAPQTPNEVLQARHEPSHRPHAGGVFASVDGVFANYGLPARDSGVSPGMCAHMPGMRVLSSPMPGLMPGVTTLLSHTRVHTCPMCVVEGRDTVDMSRLRVVSSAASPVAGASRPADGILQGKAGACSRELSRRHRNRCVGRPACGPQHRSCGTCGRSFLVSVPASGTNECSDARFAVSCRASHRSGFATTWQRFAGNPNRRSAASEQRRAHARCADLWLAYVGPQKGHGQAQACPSKHPDGYREVPF